MLVVTDGEPTAHLAPTASPEFHWPPTQQTPRGRRSARWSAGPVRRADQLLHARRRPGLLWFITRIGRRNGGRVFQTRPGPLLGEYVVADYLRARRGRR